MNFELDHIFASSVPLGSLNGTVLNDSGATGGVDWLMPLGTVTGSTSGTNITFTFNGGTVQHTPQGGPPEGNGPVGTEFTLQSLSVTLALTTGLQIVSDAKGASQSATHDGGTDTLFEYTFAVDVDKSNNKVFSFDISASHCATASAAQSGSLSSGSQEFPVCEAPSAPELPLGATSAVLALLGFGVIAIRNRVKS